MARGRAAVSVCAYLLGRAAPGTPAWGRGRWGFGPPPPFSHARPLHVSAISLERDRDGDGGRPQVPWNPPAGLVEGLLRAARPQGRLPAEGGAGPVPHPVGLLHRAWARSIQSTAAPLGAARRHTIDGRFTDPAGEDPARLEEEKLGLAAVEAPDPGFIPGHRSPNAPPPGGLAGLATASSPGRAPGGAGGLCRPFISQLPGDERALRAVYVALCANTAIMASKAIAYGVTGSSSMMAEAIHSLADVANQLLLWHGIRSTHKNPDRHYNYGYMRERFVWSLISAVGILCMGSGVTFIHGVHMMMDPHPIEHVEVGMAVLGASMVLEGWSLAVAVRALQEAAREKDMSFWRFVKKGQDPTSIAVMMEDVAAVSGLVVAGSCLAASVYTGNPIFDGAGSVMVAGLLGAIATFLINKNRSFLIGRSMDHADTGRILAHIQADSVVKAIHDVKTEEVGPGVYRFKAEIEFNGEELVERHLSRTGRAGLFQLFRSASGEGASDEALEAIVKQYGEAVVEALGDEVDRIEEEIVELVPGIRHVDIEAY